MGKRLRSIPITGVMPEPAVTNSSLPPPAGSTNSPCGLLEVHQRAGRKSCTRWWLTRPSGTALTVIEIRPSGRGPWVSEYARHWRTPSTSRPMRRYWPGTWPAQSAPGLMSRVAASLVSGWTEMTLPRSSAPGRSGREEVEEVGRHERAAGGLRHAAQLGAQGAPGVGEAAGELIDPACPIDVTNS